MKRGTLKRLETLKRQHEGRSRGPVQPDLIYRYIVVDLS